MNVCPVCRGAVSFVEGRYISLIDGQPVAGDDSDGRGRLGQLGTPAYWVEIESDHLKLADGCPGWRIWLDEQGDPPGHRPVPRPRRKRVVPMNNIEHPNPTRHADEHWIEDRTRYNEDTLLKVRQGLKITGLDDEEITDLISGMLNEGILFRERIAKNFQT